MFLQSSDTWRKAALQIASLWLAAHLIHFSCVSPESRTWRNRARWLRHTAQISKRVKTSRSLAVQDWTKKTPKVKRETKCLEAAQKKNLQHVEHRKTTDVSTPWKHKTNWAGELWPPYKTSSAGWSQSAENVTGEPDTCWSPESWMTSAVRLWEDELNQFELIG